NICNTDTATSTIFPSLGLNWCTAAATLLLLVGPAALAVQQNRERQASKIKTPQRLPLHEINHPYAIRTHFNVYTATPEPVYVEHVHTVVTTPIYDVTTAEESEKHILDVNVEVKLEENVTNPITKEQGSVLLDVDDLVKKGEIAPNSVTDEESLLPELTESLDDPTKREVSYHPSIKSLVPFCTIQGYLDLVKRLKPLVGENTGHPLTTLAGSLALAINFCQYGTGSSDILNNVPLAPEQFKMQPAFSILTDDIKKPQPPKRWPGLSFPSLNEFQGPAPILKSTTEGMPLFLMLLFNNSVVATNDTNLDGVIVDVNDEDISEALDKGVSVKVQADVEHSELNSELLNSNEEISTFEIKSPLSGESTEESTTVNEELIHLTKNKNKLKGKLSKIKIVDTKPSKISNVSKPLEKNIGAAVDKPKINSTISGIDFEDTSDESDNDYDIGTGIGTG
ncbi:unnamed protein product, partial [Meganyctiphanes norvegica]